MKLTTLLLLASIISLVLTQSQTLAGRYSAEYASSHDFRDRRDIERFRTVRVNFEEEFDDPPKVAVALYSFSLNYGSAGVWVEVDDVFEDFFTFRIYVPEGAALNNIGVAWIASDSNRVNFDYYEDDNPNTQGSGPNTRISTTVNFPQLPNGGVEALAFVAGFQFEGTDDPLLHAEIDDVDRNSVDLDIFVNENNVPTFVRILVIHYRSNYADSLSAETDNNGELSEGSGDRHDYEQEFIDRDDYLGYNALSGFFFEDHLGYRLRTTVNFSNAGSQTRARFDFKTWKSTIVHKAWANLLYQPLPDDEEEEEDDDDD